LPLYTAKCGARGGLLHKYLCYLEHNGGGLPKEND